MFWLSAFAKFLKHQICLTTKGTKFTKKIFNVEPEIF